MQDVPWDAVASYNGHSSTLFDCVQAWRRDAQRLTGALGSIEAVRAFQMKGWRCAKSRLDAAECLDLVGAAKSVEPVRRRPASPS